MFDFMKTPKGITCPICRAHFNSWMKKHDPTAYVKSRHDLFRFFWELHNDVNKRKKKTIMLFEDAEKCSQKRLDERIKNHMVVTLSNSLTMET